MRNMSSTPVRVMAVVATGSVFAAISAFPASAAEGDVEVVNTETVKIYTDATGEVTSKRIYEQLALTGQGAVDITNPVIADGLRNLDGFGGFDLEDGQQVVNVDVDGEENLRTVSDYDGDMPLDIVASYTLDGEEIDPEDVVGESGELNVTYTVKNITQETQLVSFDDGKGGTMSREVDVMMPMVGSLTTTLPNNFRNVESQANKAGDGEGGTKLSFTMTLLAPVGSDTAELSYTADVVDAVVPDASISALPVNPLDVPSFKSAGDSYQSGASTGAELANGAATIDANLLKLRDGASELLAGMIQLRDGAGELNKGLADTAVPGAMKLAAGNGDLHTGMGRLYAGTLQLSAGSVQLDDGAVQLADGTILLKDGTVKLADGAGQVAEGSKLLAEGAGTLAGGTSTARQGAQDLTDGLGKISGGLDVLSGKLPGAQKGINDLQAGVEALLHGFGPRADPNDPGLIGGLMSLNDPAIGLPAASAGATALANGLPGLVAPLGNPSLVTALALVDGVKSGLEGLDLTKLDQLIQGATALQSLCGAGNNACITTATAVKDGLAQLKAGTAGLPGAVTSLGQARAILDGTITKLRLPAADGGAIAGAQQLAAGLTKAKVGAAALLVGAQELKGGLFLVQGGLESLEVGITSAVDGVLELNAGAGDAYAGSGELTAGLGKIDDGAGDLAAGAGDLSDGAGQVADGAGDLRDGAGDLADGAGKLSAGTGDLADGAGDLADGAGEAYEGSGLLADGAGQLADGLGDAADGSGLLFDGLTAAALGVPKLRDGAQKLSDKGTSKLVDAGLSTAQEYGLMYATLEAGGERADKSKMMVGAPEDAIGLAAYSYEIKGEDGEGGRNLTRGLAGLALLGAGGAAFALRRRFI
jgi:putative membrane protein